MGFAVHALSCTLLWRILKTLSCPYPFLISLLFCVHPINTEAVAWIFQTKTTLSAALILASSLCYLRMTNEHRTRNDLAALLCFTLANLAKISVVTWPFVFLAYEWYRAGYRISREAVRRLAPFFLVSLILGLVNVLWYAPLSPSETIRDNSFWGRLVGAGQITAFSFYKMLVPLNVNLIYPRWSIDPSNPSAWIPTALISAAGLISSSSIKGGEPGLSRFLRSTR